MPSDHEINEANNRKRAETLSNAGQDPGGAYGDLSTKYKNQQESQQQQKRVQHSGKSCFPRDTLILTPFGWREIGTIKKGGTVVSLSPIDEMLTHRTVLNVKVHQNPSQIWVLHFSDSEHALRTTRSHTFLTKRGWVRTLDLVEGDLTQRIESDGSMAWHKIVSVKATPTQEPTFNLTTYGDNNFIVRGAVAHNFSYCRRLRSYLVNRVHDVTFLVVPQRLLA